MAEMLCPTTVDALSEIIADAARDKAALRLRGGGSRDAFGAATPEAWVIDMRGFAGIIDYDPPELVLTVGAGTPLADVQTLVAAEGQMLAFDPYDHGCFAGTVGAATIGGIVAASTAGPLRLSQGGARDHLLGFAGVSGRGEAFVAGAKVVKNVTGYDLPKLMAGSWGRLVALTEVTLKVLPRPRMRSTLLMHGLGPDAAVAAMARAMGSSADVLAAAHLPDWRGTPVTALRLDGFPDSVAARTKHITGLCAEFAPPVAADSDEEAALWDTVRHATSFATDRPLWRIVGAPSRAPALVAALSDCDWMMDWAGGLLWVATSMAPEALRSIVAQRGGHATLIRAAESVRADVPAFHPQPATLEALEARVRQAFDPSGVFDTGRF